MVSRPTSCPSRVATVDPPASRRARCPATRPARGRSWRVRTSAARSGAGVRPGPGGRWSPGPRPRRSARRRRKSRAAARPVDAIGAAASEPEVRQRLGQAGQRGVQKVVAPHAAGDQRRREVRECGAEDPGRIGQPGSTANPSASKRAYRPTAGFSRAAAAMTAAARPSPITTRPCWPLSHRRCSAAVQTPGRPRRPAAPAAPAGQRPARTRPVYQRTPQWPRPEPR